MGIVYNRYNARTVTPLIDRKLFEKIFTENGIFEGCALSHLGSNQVSITAGIGIVKGGDFNVTAETLLVQLATSGTMPGRIYIKVDLADTVTPIKILSVCQTTLPALVQDADFNNTNGVWEMELATYTASTTAISGLTRTVKEITGVAEEETVLWTNSSPTSLFAGQTVPLSEAIENFKKYEIEYALDNNASPVCQTTGKIKINCKTGMCFASTANVNRFVTSVPSGTSIVFGNGTLTTISPYSTGTDNTRCIPLRIIGYK